MVIRAIQNHQPRTVSLVTEPVTDLSQCIYSMIFPVWHLQRYRDPLIISLEPGSAATVDPEDVGLWELLPKSVAVLNSDSRLSVGQIPSDKRGTNE